MQIVWYLSLGHYVMSVKACLSEFYGEKDICFDKRIEARVYAVAE